MKYTLSPTPAEASFLNKLAVLPEGEALAMLGNVPAIQKERLATVCLIDPQSPTRDMEIATYAKGLFAKYLCHA